MLIFHLLGIKYKVIISDLSSDKATLAAFDKDMHSYFNTASILLSNLINRHHLQ